MKVLLDTCVWGGVRKALESLNHDVVWSGDWDADPGDSEILAKAFAERRVLVTLDKDFGEQAVVHKVPHSGIVRLVGLPAKEQGHVCARVLERYGPELLAGAIITAQRDRLRIRPPDLP